MSHHNSASTTRHRKYAWSLIAILIAAILCLWAAFPPQDKINQGLDIQGGLSVVLQANPNEGQTVTDEDMQKAKDIIEKRVNALGASEASVQIQGNNQILVQIPGMSDSKNALDTIGKTGVLEFARVDSITDDATKSSIESGQLIDYAQLNADNGNNKAPTGATTPNGGIGEASNYPHITIPEGSYDVMTTGDHITNVTVTRQSDTSAHYAVNITMDSEGTQAWATATTAIAPTKGQIAIILDHQVMSAPATQDAITTGQVQITGNFSQEEAQSLATVLDSGSLPVSFTYEQSQTVGPTLGQGELRSGVMAMLAGVIVVILYLMAFYRGFGAIASVNMLIFSIIYMGMLALLSRAGVFSLSLAGIAGIILSIGTAADSAVLTIEKFKEELKEGKSLKSASQSGVKHAVITSLDADVVSLISALSLFVLASSSVKGFGLTLALGILCDILVMLVFIVPTVRLLAPHAMKRNPSLWGVKYAIQLGDVRTGSHNYKFRDEVKEEDSHHKEERKAQRLEDKKKSQREKENSKLARRKAKETSKQSKKKNKESRKSKSRFSKRQSKRIIDGKKDEKASKNDDSVTKSLASSAKAASHESASMTENLAKHAAYDMFGEMRNSTPEENRSYNEMLARKSTAIDNNETSNSNSTIQKAVNDSVPNDGNATIKKGDHDKHDSHDEMKEASSHSESQIAKQIESLSDFTSVGSHNEEHAKTASSNGLTLQGVDDSLSYNASDAVADEQVSSFNSQGTPVRQNRAARRAAERGLRHAQGSAPKGGRHSGSSSRRKRSKKKH